jgi:hypothetical protein
MAFVITPGGAWCRLILLAGALTEVSESGGMIRCRVADPTGAFDLVTGGGSNPIAATIKNLPVPSFVMVSGYAQSYRKNGAVILSVRPEHIQVVDRTVRDQWILTTASATLDRLETLRQVMKGIHTDDRLLAALQQYSLAPARLEELVTMIENAIKTVKLPEDREAVLGNARALVLALLEETKGPRGIAVEEIIDQLAEKGVVQEMVLAAVESLIVEDECYQPQKGFVKLL